MHDLRPEPPHDLWITDICLSPDVAEHKRVISFTGPTRIEEKPAEYTVEIREEE